MSQESSASDSSLAPLLSVEGAGKRYGPTWVLREADLTLRPGQVLALLGENGAGKSTLIKILSGAIHPDAGRVVVRGRALASGRPGLARRMGLAVVYQELSVCPDLSVEDNIMLGQEQARGGWLCRGAQRRRVLEVLDRLGHPELRPERRVGSLSVGAQQLVEIARALVQDARVLILDEPTSSLPRADVRRLFETVRRLADSGLAVIYISHFLEEVRELCDSYLVLRDGRVAGSGRLEEVTEEEIVRLMVGRSVEELFPTVPHQPGEAVLEIERLSGRPIPVDVRIELRRGEILGVAGLVGAGRTELVRLISGLDAPASGGVRKGGRAAAATPAARIAAGVAMISEDRKSEGLALEMSIRDNATLSRLAPYRRAAFLNERSRSAACEDLMRRLQIKASGPDQMVGRLSGGNQQKVAIARALHQDADVLLMDEPTRGVDVGTKAEIYRLMGAAAAEGRSVVFVSSYFRELLQVCDRIAVMARGRLVDVRPAREWDEHKLLLASMGGAADPGSGG